MNISNKLCTVVILIGCAMAANAQNGVQVMNRAYQEAPPLPILPATSSPYSSYMANGQRVWQVVSTDVTIRGTIERWAGIGGWTFGVEHWASDRDLPVSAQTAFQGDFRGAIRSLLASTELTDLPLQPCFYNNGVLRVVPRAELCDRMAPNDR